MDFHPLWIGYRFAIPGFACRRWLLSAQKQPVDRAFTLKNKPLLDEGSTTCSPCIVCPIDVLTMSALNDCSLLLREISSFRTSDGRHNLSQDRGHASAAVATDCIGKSDFFRGCVFALLCFTASACRIPCIMSEKPYNAHKHGSSAPDTSAVGASVQLFDGKEDEMQGGMQGYSES